MSGWSATTGTCSAPCTPPAGIPPIRSRCDPRSRSSAACCSTGPIARRRSATCIISAAARISPSRSRTDAAPIAAIMYGSGRCWSRARKSGRSGSATPPSIAASASASTPAPSPTTSMPISMPSGNSLAADLEAAGMVEAKYQVTGVGPTLAGRNGGGDLYYTDGEVWILRLVEACARQTVPGRRDRQPGGDRDQGPDLAGGGGGVAEMRTMAFRHSRSRPLNLRRRHSRDASAKHQPSVRKCASRRIVRDDGCDARHRLGMTACNARPQCDYHPLPT